MLKFEKQVESRQFTDTLLTIDQVDNKNEWLFLSASFTAKFEFAFVLTLQNALSYSFHFKANRKSIDSSKKR